MIAGLGDLNFSVSLAAVGSGLGAGAAGMAAIGVWKKAFAQNKSAPFLIVAFVGAPLTQTFYGFLLSNKIREAALGADMPTYLLQMSIGLVAGIALAMSAYAQGRAAASACDAFGETGKGFAQYMMVLGIIETVALLVMFFCMMALPKG